MYYLFGLKKEAAPRLVATFDSEPLLLSYVRWATLGWAADGSTKFEQGTPLAGFNDYKYAVEPTPNDDPASVVHNPSPSML